MLKKFKFLIETKENLNKISNKIRTKYIVSDPKEKGKEDGDG